MENIGNGYVRNGDDDDQVLVPYLKRLSVSFSFTSFCLQVCCRLRLHTSAMRKRKHLRLLVSQHRPVLGRQGRRKGCGQRRGQAHMIHIKRPRGRLHHLKTTTSSHVRRSPARLLHWRCVHRHHPCIARSHFPNLATKKQSRDRSKYKRRKPNWVPPAPKLQILLLHKSSEVFRFLQKNLLLSCLQKSSYSSSVFFFFFCYLQNLVKKSGASKYKEENPITTGTQASDSSSLQILVKICLLSSESCKKFSDGSKYKEENPITSSSQASDILVSFSSWNRERSIDFLSNK